MNHSPKQYRDEFLASELAVEIKEQLRSMEADMTYITKTSYSTLSATDISFTDKHFTYLCTHPTTKPREYLANLRLKTKVRNYKN